MSTRWMTLSAARIRTAGSWAAGTGNDPQRPAGRGVWAGPGGKPAGEGGALGEGDRVQESPPHPRHLVSALVSAHVSRPSACTLEDGCACLSSDAFVNEKVF